MVRSILFTGDCAAARAVHEKKMEERRLEARTVNQTQAGAAGPCRECHDPVFRSALGESETGRHSQSRIRKTTGTGHYGASVNPVKKAINEYLSRLASCQDLGLSQAPAEAWVLALETRDLLTVTSLEAVGFHPGRIVVPNPNRSEVEAMQGEDLPLKCGRTSRVQSEEEPQAPDRSASERTMSSVMPRAGGDRVDVARVAAGAREFLEQTPLLPHFTGVARSVPPHALNLTSVMTPNFELLLPPQGASALFGSITAAALLAVRAGNARGISLPCFEAACSLLVESRQNVRKSATRRAGPPQVRGCLPIMRARGSRTTLATAKRKAEHAANAPRCWQ